MSLRKFCEDWYNGTARRDWDGVTVDDIRRDIDDKPEADDFDPQDVYDEMMWLVAEDDRINAAPDSCMNMTATFDEFKACIMRGESRTRPGVCVGYVLLIDDDTECFYAEWPYNGTDNLDVQDDWQSEFAYRAYREGCDEYIAYI